jgi:hypothetical protein
MGGGVAVLKKMIDQSGFSSYLDSLPLPEQGSNRGLSCTIVFAIYECRLVWSGTLSSSCLLHNPAKVSKIPFFLK